MRLWFFGAARTVTGSMHLLEAAGKRILLDCGLFQGHRQEAFERNRSFPFDPSQVDCLILSHAHIDHSGNIPTLVKQGFRGDIYATFATRDLCGAMLLDSAHIQEQDAEYVNRRKKPSERVAPLYGVRDAVDSLTYFKGVGYHRSFMPNPGVTVEFLDAGHILGSAITVITVTEQSRTTRLVFTGDLGWKGMPLIRDPESVADADSLICESTYGGRVRHPAEDIERELEEVIVRTAGRGGKVIIPAFAVGRTQEVVYTLHRLFNAKRLPDLPIYVDSPLAVNVTSIFRLHPECFDEETCRLLLSEGDPFGFGRLRYTRTVEESKRLNDLRLPCVIISASGMCETGRVLHHLKNNIEDARNTILIVSFQADGTLGRKLVDRAPDVRIFGESYTRRADVAVINGFSAHADRNGLLDWISGVGTQLKRVFLVHGNPDQAEALADGIRAVRSCAVTIPERGEWVDL
ncbi:MAG: MBL fold metallo-hydrolase [Candidatus Latescibacteria bacterium]|nr:MBL fold metallo-hydrolase [Candidatus Latescibacterota bacterium]